MGNARWRRLTEVRAGSAKSVFHFDVPGSVAKSTHAGLPWLRYLRNEVRARVHFWPYDGWGIPPQRSAVVEVYPSLWSRGYDRDGHSSIATTERYAGLSDDAVMREVSRTLSASVTRASPEVETEDAAL